MVVTSTDFKTNLGKYLNMIDTDDITITRNGRKIAKLVKAEDDTITEIHSLLKRLLKSSFLLLFPFLFLPQAKLPLRAGQQALYVTAVQYPRDYKHYFKQNNGFQPVA